MKTSRKFSDGNSQFYFLSIVLSLHLIIVFIQGSHFYDDAFITFRYSRNLIDGFGFVYNPGQQVLGTTSPLFSLVLAAAGRIAGATFIPAASFIISIIAEAANLFLIYRLGKYLFDDQLAAMLATLLYLLNPLRISVSGGGMETSLYVTILLTMYERYLIGKRMVQTGIFATLAYITRPDAILAILPLLFVSFVTDRKQALRISGTSLATISPFMLWMVYSYNNLIPQSILAKSQVYQHPPLQAAAHLLTFIGTGTINLENDPRLLIASGVFAMILIAAGIVQVSRRRPDSLSLLLYPVVYIIVMSVLNPGMWFPWYYPPMLPGIIFSMIGAFWFVCRKLDRKIILALLLTVFFLGIPLKIGALESLWDPGRERETTYFEACRAIKEQVKPGDRVAATDIGVIGWCLEQADILDVIGLVSPEALPYSKEMDGVLISPALIKDMKPRFIITSRYFLSEAVLKESNFLANYSLIWEQALASSEHIILVYQNTTEN